MPLISPDASTPSVTVIFCVMKITVSMNYHKPELKDSKNRSFHTVLNISNSIYGRYTLFN